MGVAGTYIYSPFCLALMYLVPSFLVKLTNTKNSLPYCIVSPAKVCEEGQKGLEYSCYVNHLG